MEPTLERRTGDPADLTGQVIGGYTIESILGAGGMGVVYKAFDRALARHVAIKMTTGVSHPPDFYARFDRETRALSAVSHPNIAAIYTSGRHEGRPFYVMEYIDGSSLQETVDRGERLSGLQCLRYLIEAASGLQAAHERGIIHRDIKPSNLMVDGRGHLKIVDFGLAKHLNDDVSLTATAMAIGTPRYMSPEQARAEECDHRSDIYSLGATFYHLFAGDPPFDADSPVALLLHHVNTPLPPLRDRNPRVPTAVCAIIEKMLEKGRSDRYQSYDELISDLKAVQATGTAPTIRLPRARRQRALPKLQPWMLLVAGVALFTLLAVIVGIRNRPEEPTAAAAVVTPLPAGSTPPEPRIVRSAPGPLSASPPLDAPPSAAAEEAEPVATGTIPAMQIPRFEPPADIMQMAYGATTMANMRKLSTAIESWKAEHDALPESLDDLARLYEIHPQALVDGWKRPIVYERAGTGYAASFRLISAGADGFRNSADDLVIENGYLVQGPEGFMP